MRKNINKIAIEELFSQNSNGFLPVLLEVYNPDLAWNDNSTDQEDTYLRVINDTTRVKYKGKTYLPCQFEFDPPEENGKSTGNATITISSIDSRIPQMLGECKIPCIVNICAAFAKQEYETDENEQVLSSKFIFIPITKWKFQAKVATCNSTTAVLTLSGDDYNTTNLPRDLAMQNQFPSVSSTGE